MCFRICWVCELAQHVCIGSFCNYGILHLKTIFKSLFCVCFHHQQTPITTLIWDRYSLTIGRGASFMGLQFARLEIDSCKMWMTYVRYHLLWLTTFTFIPTTRTMESKGSVELWMHINKRQREDTPARINSAPSEHTRMCCSMEQESGMMMNTQ
jgi:hypothetical protein